MFYRIKNDKVYDYADYEYEKDCLMTDLCTMSEYAENPEKFIICIDMADNKQKLVQNPNWQGIIIEKRKDKFYKQFFETSLGWIRRKVSMKDGSTKDFLGDLLLPIKAGLELGQEVHIITYLTPDFSVEPDDSYMESLQEIKLATPAFIKECLEQTVNDFGLNIGGSDGI